MQRRVSNVGIYFNGRYYIRPQVATFVDDTALTPVGLVGSNVIGMMGPAKDGIPNQAYLLTSLNDATDIFGEGPLVDGVAMAFNGGAQYIWATRVAGIYSNHTFSSVPTQAIVKTTGNTAMSPTTSPFRLLSKAYGTHSNGIIVTTSYTNNKFDITVSSQQNIITGTGIGYDVLKIVADVGAPASTSFVTATNGSVYELIINDGTNSTPTIDLVGVASTTDLVEQIKSAMLNAVPSAIDSSKFIFTVMKEVPGTYFDATTVTVDASDSGIMTANMRAAFDWFNGGNQPYVYAEDEGNIFKTSETKTISDLAPRTINFAYAAQPGSIGIIDATSYLGALAEIYEDLDLDLIVPIVDDYLGLTNISNADAIFSFVNNHCKEMSTIKSEERIGLVGYQFTDYGGKTPDGAPDALVETLIGKSTNFNSPYMVVCSPRFKAFDIKGNLKYFNGTYTAAYIAGLIASFPVGEPITNKDVTGMQGLSTYFLNRHVLQLIDNGVLVVEKTGGSLKVVQGVTSWVADDNFNKKEISVRLATNYIAKNCRDNLKQFIGRKNSPQILQIIKGSLIQVLRELENNEIIVGTLTYPAYRNLILTVDGDSVRVSFECSPVLPINYILITIHATIFKATI